MDGLNGVRCGSCMLGVHESIGGIAAALITCDLSDGALMPERLDQIDEPTAQVSGDGAYDMREWLKRRSRRGAVGASGNIQLQVCAVGSRREPAAVRRFGRTA